MYRKVYTWQNILSSAIQQSLINHKDYIPEKTLQLSELVLVWQRPYKITDVRKTETTFNTHQSLPTELVPLLNKTKKKAIYIYIYKSYTRPSNILIKTISSVLLFTFKTSDGQQLKIMMTMVLLVVMMVAFTLFLCHLYFQNVKKLKTVDT